MNIAALLAGLFSGILGSMGLGGGAVLIIYLALFTETPHFTAQGINLIFFIPIALIAVIIYTLKKQIKWKLIFKVVLWGLLGAVLGLLATQLLGGRLTAKLFGALLCILGAKELFFTKTKK